MPKLNLRETRNKKKWCSDKIEDFVNSTVREAFSPPVPFDIGTTYIFRTINMCNIGKVISIVGNFIILNDDAVWVVDAGKWGELLERTNLDKIKIEPFNNIVGMNINMIVDWTKWKWEIPNG